MKIRLHRHPFAPCAPQEFEVESLALWLLDHYGPHPKVQVRVFAGEPSGETEITGNIQAILAAEAPEYVVLETPGTGAEIIPMLVSMVISAAINYMLAPSVKPIANRTQESPNNQLSNRENRVRVLERVEDIYGTVRSIPSLLMPSYRKYHQHLAVEYGYYCIGRGYHDISDVRDGDTLLGEVLGASAAVYAPFTSPNSGHAPQLQIGDPIIDGIHTVVRSGSVDGITLRPLNQLRIAANKQYYFYSEGPGISGLYPTHAGDMIYQAPNSRVPNFAAVAEVGQTLTIEMEPQTVTRLKETVTFTVDGDTNTYTASSTGFFRGIVIGSKVTVTGFAKPDNSGEKTVTAVTGETLTVAEALLDEGITNGQSFVVVVDYSGTRTLAAVGNGYVLLSGPPQVSTEDYPLNGNGSSPPGNPGGDGVLADLVVDNGLTDWTDWFTLPSTDRTEVWANVLAQNGLYKDAGGKSTISVSYQMQIEKLTALLAPTGVVETVSGTLSGATSNERADTLERVTAWTGPARARMRRTTPYDYGFPGFVNDEIKWVDLFSVSPVDKSHFGDLTTIHTITQATVRATNARRRELNCLASRKLPIYNGSTFSGAFNADGRLVSGTISATSKIVDIIAAVARDPKIGNRNLATDVDLAQIWATQQALDAWSPECGRFNYTFDSDAISFEETLNVISNAAFCIPYRQNGKIRLALDRPQAFSTALFTHRNKKPSQPGSPAEVITRKFASDAEYDGVEFLYDDPDTESKETIRLPLNGDYTKLKKIEIPGIRSFKQAWIRANREYNRLRSQRLFIETETTADARALLPNTRIDIVDNTRFRSFDGEVVAQSGLTLTLSREVEFLPSTPHSIVLMKRDGSLQSIACTQVAGEPNKVLLASYPAEAIVTDATPEDGIRTIFSFAADSARGAMAWLVQELRPKDKYIQIAAINYSDAYYSSDSAPIPDKSGVIFD